MPILPLVLVIVTIFFRSLQHERKCKELERLSIAISNFITCIGFRIRVILQRTTVLHNCPDMHYVKIRTCVNVRTCISL
jgi:hypothetical protein